MGSRLLSPSSINTFKQCPRKFYYQYIKRLKTTESIHLIRGSIAHTVLENVYDLDVEGVRMEVARIFFGSWMLKELKREWEKNQKKLEGLGLSSDQLQFYFEETRLMLRNWLDYFVGRLKEHGGSLQEAFLSLKPMRETKLSSDQHSVMGFVDVIEMVDDQVKRVIDYKTSAKDKMTDAYQLQLAIYALLVHETFGHHPEEVVIHFLRHGERSLKVHPEMLEYAKKEVAWVLERTQSQNIDDYPKIITPLCKWENARGSGQCDFYDHCFVQKVL